MDEEIKVTFTLDEEQPIDCIFKIDAVTFDYETLDKKPQINGETLIGDKSSSDLHLASEQGLLDLDEKVDGINANLTQQIEETQQDVNNKYNELVNDIDEEIQARETADITINQRITDVADELQQSIEENVVALQQEDTALQNQINAHSTTLTAYDIRITNNANAITQEVTNRQNADDNLQEQIDNLKARGRFLSLWNATTGLAETNPEIDPYPYNTGDYFIVGTVGETNYKPTGTQYVIGQASTVVETEELATEDVYYFDGSVWHLQVNHGKTVSFANLAGQPSDNIALKQALDSKQDVISDLTTIRDNASDGKVASDTIATYGNIVTHNADEFQPVGDYATNTALNQGLATKQNKTDNNLVTTDKTVVGAVNELDSKIKEIELFKFPNALIIGEPTINNGQISGFSQTSYLALPFLFDVHDRAFELDYAFRTGSNVTTPQNLFGSNYCIASYISNGKLTVRVSSNGTSWNALDVETSLTIQANTTYYIKLVFNRLNYTILASTNGSDYSQIGYKVTTEQPHVGEVYIGIGNNQNNPFLGIINLHKWMIKLNNAVIWQGMDDAGLATRADISLSNLDEQGEARFEAKQDVIQDLEQIRTNANLVTTKQDIISDLSTIRSNASIGAGLAPQVAVNTQRIEDLTTARIPDVIYHGTPKITGGQISNFSTINYLQFPFEDISRGLPFDIYFSFTTSDDVTTQQNIIDSRFGIALAIKNGRGVMALSSNGTSWDIGSATGTNTLLGDTTYYVKYSWTGSEYNASLSTNDQTYVPDMILQSNKSPYKTTIYIGGCDQQKTGHTPHPFKGIINFTKSRVVVNGITVWEGMADVGIASRANVSLNNLDEVGEKRFTDLQTAIDTKANDTDVVHKTGDETISGVKTFSNTPIISSGYINLNNASDVAIQKQSINFIRKASGGQLVLSGSSNNIYLRPNGDTNQNNQVTIGINGTVTAPKFSGLLDGTATKATQDGDGNVISTTYQQIFDIDLIEGADQWL